MKELQFEIELKKRLQYESIVRQISSRFVRVDNLDLAINESLADMGLLCQAIRAYLFLLRSNGTLMDNTHEWCTRGVSAQIQHLQGLAVDTFPWWMEKLNHGKAINVNDVSIQVPAIASKEKAFLKEQHIKSKLVLPVMVKGKLAGFVGFDRVEQAETWSADNLSLLKVAVEIIGGALERQRITDELRESEFRYRNFYEYKGNAMVIIDSLTGVFNQNYFKQMMQNYNQDAKNSKVALVVCDVDGLKLMNKILGHNMGDALLFVAARILKEAFQSEGIVARIGGDKFGILIPGGEDNMLYKACASAKRALTKHNTANPRLYFNMSVGFAFKIDNSKTMDELYKEADNNMYREKLLHIQSNRGALAQTFRTAPETRDFIACDHADRIQHLMIGFLKTIDSTVYDRTNLTLLANFHDIGKIDVPKQILLKPGPLTDEERNIMQRHCEIGYRIAMSSPELASIADWILKHHEWWNGKGYPLGIKGDEIPTACRVLAIADAYDAMTSKRPYRQIMSRDEAINEIKKCAGTQFDPALAQRFIKFLNTRDSI